MTSPTQRTLALLRKQGYTAVIVERYNAFSRRRIDLFGGDILALKEGDGGPLLVQCTTRTNQNARFEKVIRIPEVKLWLDCGGRFAVWGWAKVKALTGKAKRWQVSIRAITMEDLVDDHQSHP